MEKPFEPERPQEPKKDRVETVQVYRIRAEFDDAEKLKKIAHELLKEGIVSGANVEEVQPGYVYKGKMVKPGDKPHFALDILLSPDAPEDLKEKVRETIRGVVEEKWDVPSIQEEPITVNKGLLGFIENAGVEHKKWRRERRLRRTLVLSLVLTLGSLLGVLGKKVVEDRAERAVAAERMEQYKRVRELQEKVLAKVTPTDMAATTTFEDPEGVLRDIEELRRETEKLARAGEK